MLSTKRKALDGNIQRRVKARRESSEELELSGSEEPLHDEAGSETENSDDTDNTGENDESESSESEAKNDDVATISFGALAKAQASLAGEGPGSKPSSKKKGGGDTTWTNDEAIERKAGRKDHRDFNRSSKHAPAELSSKKAVSRKREVIPVKKREYRDPRFEPLAGPLDKDKIEKAYSFLDDYREDEMKQLREAIKTTKNEDEKERMKRELLSMESKKKADLRKKKAQEVLDQHKKEEKEHIKQGKKPFFLKKSEQKKRVLLEQYGELKGKQLDRVIERRRKKVETKEKKRLPFARRTVDS
ncbi:hypothetical protein B7463_g8939, partial [Scytalidium lignicola]